MGNYNCYFAYWRHPHQELTWTSEFRDKLIKEVEDLSAQMTVKPCVLLIGPAKAGKSSLIDTFLSVGTEDIVSKAQIGCNEYSFTLKFTRFDALGKLNNAYRLCDTMGIHEKESIRPTDIVKVIKGHVLPDYKFQTTTDIPKNRSCYVEDPTEEARSHCLVVVIACDAVKSLKEQFLKAVTDAVLLCRMETDIPTVVILTKADRLCANVMYDHRKIFTCWHVKEIVSYTSELLGIPEGHIFPVINYAEQVSKHQAPHIDTIALLALKNILKSSYYYMEGTESRKTGATCIKLQK